jgi:conjugative transfer region protein TrbK
MSVLPRAIAYIALAVALLAAAITINVGKYATEEASSLELSAATTDLNAELARCKKLSPETVDAACLVVWEANRHRFFQTGKSHQDRVTDTVPAAPDSKDGAKPGVDDALSDVSRRSPESASSRSPVDSPERRK